MALRSNSYFLFGNEFTEKIRNYQIFEKLFLVFLGCTELLYVNGMLHLQALQDRRFVELLTTTQFLHHTCLFKLSLKLLEGLFDVLAFFYRYNNHTVF